MLRLLYSFHYFTFYSADFYQVLFSPHRKLAVCALIGIFCCTADILLLRKNPLFIILVETIQLVAILSAWSIKNPNQNSYTAQKVKVTLRQNSYTAQKVESNSQAKIIQNSGTRKVKSGPQTNFILNSENKESWTFLRVLCTSFKDTNKKIK